MANYEELVINSGHLGLVTNISAVDADKQSFREFKNLQANSPGLLSALPGAGIAQLLVQGISTDIPAFPSGFMAERSYVFHLTTPNPVLQGSDVIVLFGSKNGRDRFLCGPILVPQARG